MNNIALGVIDYQVDFAEPFGKLYVLGGEKLKSKISHLIFLARIKGRVAAIFHSCDQHSFPDPEFEIWPPHCIAGTQGAEFIFSPRYGEIVIAKSSFEYSAFRALQKNPPRGQAETRRLNIALGRAGIDTLVLVGLAYDFCVGQTALDAIISGYRVYIVEDCTRAVALHEKDGKPNSEATMRADLIAQGIKHISFYEAADMFGAIK